MPILSYTDDSLLLTELDFFELLTANVSMTSFSFQVKMIIKYQSVQVKRTLNNIFSDCCITRKAEGPSCSRHTGIPAYSVWKDEDWKKNLKEIIL